MEVSSSSLLFVFCSFSDEGVIVNFFAYDCVLLKEMLLLMIVSVTRVAM